MLLVINEWFFGSQIEIGNLMGDSFQNLDILLFAGIAVFLILKLGRTLGKRTGHEDSPEDTFSPISESPEDKDDNVVELPSQRRRQEEAEKQYESDNSPLSVGVAQIRKIDSSFNPIGFIDGANAAFEMVLKAFVEADGNTLKQLLSPSVFESFSNAIREREKANQRIDDTLIGIDTSDILEAHMDGSVAHVTVKFVTQQVNVLYDADDNVLEGDPHKVIPVTDIWTFVRDTKSRDPNWVLASTRSQN